MEREAIWQPPDRIGFRSPLLGDIPIVVNKLLGQVAKQVRFPKSRKRRIRKKWAKRKSNYVVAYTEPLIYQFGGLWICNPPAYAAILKECKYER